MAKLSCPSCSYSRSWIVRGNKRKCKKCRREFSGKTYPVSSFRITKEEWTVAVRVFLRERTIKRLSEEVGISMKTAQRITEHFRICMTNEIPEPFTGITEMDETYVGGQRKNKKLHIRRIKGKRGHGTDKLPIIGLFNLETGLVYIDVEPRKLDRNYVFKTIQERMVKGSSLYTDGFKMYRGITKYGYIHEFVDHEGGEYVRGDVHTNNIEGFWGILKRKMGCIGGMRREKLYLFGGEIVWKFNHRTESLAEQERALLNLIFYG